VPLRRTFITGIGVVSPHGDDLNEVFDRVFAGESSVRKVPVEANGSSCDMLLSPVDFEPGQLIPKLSGRFMARATKMAVVAAHHALEGSGLLVSGSGPAGAGIYIGCGLGGSDELQAHYERYLANPPRRLRAASTPMIMASGPASNISIQYGITGPTVTYSIACVSSAVAIGEAFRAIRHGYLDTALAGGTEAQLNPGALAGWRELSVLASEHESGAEASSRPFDAQRTGLVLGEGAVVLVLESESAARARGAELLAEIVGYGVSSDAYNLTEPSPDGQARAMRLALDDASVAGERIGYVNAHATGTLLGDRVEAKAIRDTFGSHADKLAVSSTKSVHGHLIGAASALEAALTVRMLQTGRIAPTANLTDPDPECDMDFVPLVGRDAPELEYALSNSFAFGGSNATLVLRKAMAS
jgi:3-oxoacyl-[acyl-carrier-protein] synthase II